ncbi:MAG: hypothetical protein WD403_10005 [Pirellulales bacterium]
MRRIALYLLTPALLAATAQPAQSGLITRALRGGAGHPSSCCEAKPCVCYEEVERTVMCPTWVTETRTVQVTQFRPEQRERTCVVHRRVPETRQVTRDYCVLVPETRTREVPYIHTRLEYRDETREYTVCVPEQVRRQATRRVCRMVPVTETRMVCEDQGHCEKVCEVDCCGHVTYRSVWVPKLVQRPVQVTRLCPQVTEEPCEYVQTVLRHEKRTRTVRVPYCVAERRVRQVECTVLVPQKRQKTFDVTVCKIVAEERTQTYCQMVPHQVEKQVQVRVCRMVPKTVVCRVAVRACCD